MYLILLCCASAKKTVLFLIFSKMNQHILQSIEIFWNILRFHIKMNQYQTYGRFFL